VAAAEPGSLDRAFSEDGLALERLEPGENGWVQALVIQPDGRAVVATGDRIFRYRRSGRRDLSFGVRHVPVLGLAEAPDGGLVRLAEGEIERLLPNGEPDPKFGSGGDGRVSVAGLQLFAVAVDSAGRIVAVGRDPEAHLLAVARFLPDGRPDPGFGDLGIVRTAVSAATTANLDAAVSVAVAADGGILVGGSAGQAEDCPVGALHCWGPYLDAVVLRYLPDGRLDSGFGDGGVFRKNSLWGSAHSVAARPGGGALLVPGGPTGVVEPGGGPGVIAAALNAAGNLSFAYDVSSSWLRGLASPRPSQLIVGAGGRMLVCGAIEPGRHGSFFLAMLRGDGEPIRAFGRDGLVVTRLGRKTRGLGWAGALALAPGHKLYVAGHVGRRLFVARYRL
jgi:uncharacterized delta-60 repeat protein